MGNVFTGRMTVKVTIVLCLVLVGIIEADPLSMEVIYLIVFSIKTFEEEMQLNLQFEETFLV